MTYPRDWGVGKAIYEVTPELRQQFIKWLESQFGVQFGRSFYYASDTTLRNSPQYQYWIDAGKPSKPISAPEQPTAEPYGLREGEWRPGNVPPIYPQVPIEVDHPEKVESIGGYDFLMKWDKENKKYINIATLGKTPDTGLAREKYEWDVAQAEIMRGERGQERAWKMSQAATERQDKQWLAQQVAEANAYQREANRQAVMSQTREEDIRAQERQKAAAEFEGWKATILSGVAPRDWVIREKAKAAGNPYEVQPQNIGASAQSLQVQLQTAESREKAAQASLKSWYARQLDDADFPPDYEVKIAEDRWRQSVQARRNIEDRLGELATIKAGGKGTGYFGTDIDVRQELATAEPRDIGGGNWSVGGGGAFGTPPPGKPYEPQVPEDIKRYIIGGQFGGAIQPPSGQSWTVAPYSTRERLKGYAIALGQEPADLEARIQSMFPQTPTRGARWSPRM